MKIEHLSLEHQVNTFDWADSLFRAKKVLNCVIIEKNSERSEFLRFYLYFCHVIRIFYLFVLRH